MTSLPSFFLFFLEPGHFGFSDFLFLPVIGSGSFIVVVGRNKVSFFPRSFSSGDTPFNSFSCVGHDGAKFGGVVSFPQIRSGLSVSEGSPLYPFDLLEV